MNSIFEKLIWIDITCLYNYFFYTNIYKYVSDKMRCYFTSMLSYENNHADLNSIQKQEININIYIYMVEFDLINYIDRR